MQGIKLTYVHRAAEFVDFGYDGLRFNTLSGDGVTRMNN